MYGTEMESAKIAVQCALFAVENEPFMPPHTENIWGHPNVLLQKKNSSVCHQLMKTNVHDTQSVVDMKTIKFKLQCTEKLLGDVIQNTNDIKISLLQIKATVHDIEIASLQQKTKPPKTNRNKRSHSR